MRTLLPPHTRTRTVLTFTHLHTRAGPVKLVQTDGDGVDMSTLTTLVSQTILDEAIAKLPTQEAITTLSK